MPIPEPGAYRPAKFVPPPGVSEKQAKQDQLAALYGVSTMPNEQLTETEVAHMRALLARHDGQSKPLVIHDLNNPPKQPYRFQKFPMMVYDLLNSHPSHDEQRQRQLANGGTVNEIVHVLAKVVSSIVNTEDELQSAIHAGWSAEAPNFTEDRVEDLSPAYAGEAGRIQAIIEANRAKTNVSPLDSMNKAELVALSREMGLNIDVAEKKEVFLAALKAPDQEAAA